MVPYTYLIGWSQYKQYYYGVRYAKNCHPNELWTKYKTSSTYVKSTYKLYGEPDIVQIRKTFLTAQDAMRWEHKVLRRIKAVYKEIWINKTDNAAIDFYTSKRITEPGRAAAMKATTGKTYEQIYGAEKATILKSHRGTASRRRWEDNNLRERMSAKPNDTTNYKKAAERRWQDPLKKEAAALRMKQIWAERRKQNPLSTFPH